MGAQAPIVGNLASPLSKTNEFHHLFMQTYKSKAMHLHLDTKGYIN